MAQFLERLHQKTPAWFVEKYRSFWKCSNQVNNGSVLFTVQMKFPTFLQLTKLLPEGKFSAF